MNAERSSSSASAIAATSTDRGDPPEHEVPVSAVWHEGDDRVVGYFSLTAHLVAVASTARRRA
jgi:hypothetical protein